jgi:uncharacterized protein (DUF2249 family)
MERFDLTPRPAWVEKLNPSCGYFLDIRPLTAKQLDPIPLVVRSLGELKPGQHLHLVLTDSPEPYRDALGRLGYEGFAEMKEGAWNAYFRKKQDRLSDSLVLELDVRGMEPPLPLLKVLESLPSVSEGGVLKVVYPNRPESLAEKLRAHGFQADWAEAGGDMFILYVRKKN